MKNAYKIALIALFVLSGLGIATYTVASNENSVIACVSKADGATRIINFLTSRCRPTEDVLTWAISNAGAATPGAGNVAFTHDPFLLLNSGEVVYAGFVSGAPTFLSHDEFINEEGREAMPNFSPLPLSVGRIAAWNYDSLLEKGGHFWKYKYSINQWVDFGMAPEDILTQCEDGVDNDGDGLVDMKDNDCTDPTDNKEEGIVVDVEVDFSTHPNSPEEGVIQVSQNSSTNEVLFLVGEVDVQGNSNVTLDTLPVTIFTNSSSSASAIISEVRLYANGALIGTETVQTGPGSFAFVEFDNLNYLLYKNAEVNLSIKADISAMNGNYSEGDEVTISITPENLTTAILFDEYDTELGNDLIDGSVVGDPQMLVTEYLLLSPESMKATKIFEADDIGEADVALYTIEMNATALGSDTYVSTNPAFAVTYSIVNSSGQTVDTGTTTPTVLTSSADTEGLLYKFLEDNEETIKLEFTVTAFEPTGPYKMVLNKLFWTQDVSDTTPDNVIELNSVDFDTPFVFLNIY
jgi:hypothetical protein